MGVPDYSFKQKVYPFPEGRGEEGGLESLLVKANLPQVFILPHTFVLAFWRLKDYINVGIIISYLLLNILK